MVDLATVTQQQAEAFLYREGRLIDERRFDEWLDLFTDDGVYWLPMGDGKDPGIEPSVLYDDHTFLAKRVYRLLHTRVFAQRPPSRTLHLVSNVELGRPDDSGTRLELGVYSALVVHETRTGNRMQYGLGVLRTLAGRCEHRLTVVDGELKIALKRVELIDRDLPVESLAFIV